MPSVHASRRAAVRLGLTLILGILVTLSSAQSEEWPGWRGPRGDGTSSAPRFLREWSGVSGDGMAWKTELPGSGHGSPIVWQDTVFLTTCLVESGDRLLVCLDLATGQIRWQQTVVTSPLETSHTLNSYASSTPATDGELVYTAFLKVDGSTIPAPNVSQSRPVTPGRIVVAAHDFSGRLRWKKEAGDFVSAHGFCSNPVIYNQLVIVNGDHDGDSYLVALDRHSGEIVWKTPRRHRTRSYSTPIVREIAGHPQLVLCGSLCVASFDPRNGQRWWSVDGPTEQFVASMVFDGERFFAAGGYPTYHVMAIRPDGRGDVTPSHVEWHATNARCYVPSPVVCADYLVVADDRGTAACFDRATGKRYWQARLGNHFSASLVTAGNEVMFLADDGQVTIVQAADELRVVSRNEVGEPCRASPALAGNRLLIRAMQHLYCFTPQRS